ncbi:hypothetical protein COW53_08440 [bacterium CG17_big_fil_post_rev_8_21_14_2_50_64_8]|nr:MAG: hypothetical protein COW53_08440 [bacterium CG17_big_fil_post_rev_8_21_14_2_50_64_8]PJA75828.1 MAG: hypothetical protein CO151_04690 [bacterium CG_4_9_14_3_um_filter_65_15]
MNRNKVLGKGLSALIQEADLRGVPRGDVDGKSVVMVGLDEVGLNPDQPRKLFNEAALSELATSIRSVGILQPVLLRRMKDGDNIVSHPESVSGDSAVKYGVVAGERRVRAARIAGLETIPALVCSYEGAESLKVALLENIQREDLGPVEEAEAYRHLMNALGSTQEKLADVLGKNRSTIANSLRLLLLEDEILELLQEGKISRGHGKALLGMEAGVPRVQLAKKCFRKGLSVRDCENRVREMVGGPTRTKRKSSRKTPQAEPAIRAFQERAEQVYGSPVVIDREPGSGKGMIKVRFYSDSDLVRLLKIMGVDTDL